MPLLSEQNRCHVQEHLRKLENTVTIHYFT